MSDSITTEIVRHALLSATTEMARNLCRTAYNTVVYEIHDYGIGLHDVECNTIAEAPGIAIFSGANDFGIKASVEFLGRNSLKPGDIIFCNYPYWSSAHTLDPLVFAPIFHGDELAGFASCRIHVLDLKQKNAGYVLDSTSMEEEGIFFPAVKLYAAGEIREDIFNIVRFNSRFPTQTIGDIQAMVSCVYTGTVRMQEIATKFGLDVLKSSMEEISDHGERLSRIAVEKLPDGSWSASDFIDTDGIDLETLVEMKVTVTIEGDQMIIDWRETDKPVAGPINVPIGMTIAASRLAFKALTTPDSPICAGNFRNLQVLTTEGSLMHAVPPMPTFTLWTGLLAPEVITKALAQGIPDIVPACSGGDVCDIMNLGINPRTGAPWLEATNDAVGLGAHGLGDGDDGEMHITEPGCRNNPVELLEAKGPQIIERYGFRQDSAGAGKYRGGVGVERAYRFLAPTTSIVINYKTRTRPWSIGEGKPGLNNTVILYPGTDQERHVGNSTTQFEAGGAITNLTGGGGGWGNPYERDPELVLLDVREGYVSAEAAKTDYGVVIDTNTWTVKSQETSELRSAGAS